MNIQKLVILSCFALHFSTMNADQAEWNKAFLIFGGGSDVVSAANGIDPNSQSVSSALTNASNADNTEEAKAIAHYVSSTKKTLFKSTFTDADVVNAIAAAQTDASTTAPAEDTTTVPTTDTTTVPTTTTTTPTVSATDTAATALKAQIDASVSVYNTYLVSVGQSQVKVAAA